MLFGIFICDQPVMNPNAKDNLKPFKKGEDPRRNVTGANKLPDLELLMAEGVSKEDLISIIVAQSTRAKKGDTRAADFIFDRGFGKPKQSTELTGKDGKELFPIKGITFDDPI